ncbi:MAG: efflux RND transporter periplasmic adaptor subunit [Parvibaculum sp.]|uniref:efflux RND transporter periplasmic adaptor subunit n=1 Tax=Parvibaculum sp. TaxID=2024848 RepID=UPI00272619AC|nr:efflux RND transporter periplasmic adaptor subunit [Parvibaculum sp.]MDO8838461.1 efflux RND transporter periplasmic adaptor subunit [Parvibaculum sp.]
MFVRFEFSRYARPLAAGLMALALTACGENADEEAADPDAGAIAVFAGTVTTRELAEPITGTGTIAAHKTTTLGPRVDGIIEEIMVRVGDRVSEGQPLFRTRDVELKLKVTELENQVRLAKADLRNTSLAFSRASELHAKGFVADGRLDDARAARDASQARLGIAEAQLAGANQMLTDCVVTAPFGGVITRRDVDEGKFMATRMGGMGGMGDAGGGGVLQIMKIDIVAAIVTVPEMQLSKIAVGTKGRVFIDGIDRSFDSYVAILNDYVDPVTRSVELRLPILNEDYAVKPGLFARAELYPEPRRVLSLDRRMLQGGETDRHVFLAENGVARRVSVTVRQIDAQSVEVLSGLKAGDTVLGGPNAPLLADGVRVRIEVEPGQIAAGASDSVAQ